MLRPILLAEHRRLDELGVLEAVADDRRVVVGQRHDGQQLGLRARLEAEVVRPAEVEDLLDDLPLLVDLDRVDAAVAALVLVLRDGGLEGGVDLAEAVRRMSVKRTRTGRLMPRSCSRSTSSLRSMALGGVLGRVDLHVTGVVDREVAVAPARHLVQLAGVVNAPRARRRGGRPAAAARPLVIVLMCDHDTRISRPGSH